MAAVYTEQEKYYQAEWEKISLSDQPGPRGWRTSVPAPDFVRFLNALITEHPVQRALDLGCGGGRHAILMAQSGIDTDGIDFAPAAIAKAEQYARRSKVTNTHFRVGNVLELPYADESFELVNDDGCLHHIHPDDWHLYVSNVYRVLKSGGLLRVKVFSNNCQYYERYKDDSNSQWIHLPSSHYTYFFTESNLRHLFAEKFTLLKLEEDTHSQTSEKKFLFGVFRKGQHGAH